MHLWFGTLKFIFIVYFFPSKNKPTIYMEPKQNEYIWIDELQSQVLLFKLPMRNNYHTRFPQMSQIISDE